MPAIAEAPPSLPAVAYAESDAAIDKLFEPTDDAPLPPPQDKPTEPSPTPNEPKPTAPAPAVTDQFEGDFPRSKPAPKPPTAPAPAPTATTQPQTQDTFKTPKELREAYSKAVDERRRLETEIADARKQIEAAKQFGATEAEARFKTELDQLRKEREELDTKVRYTDYTRSAEYKTKYLQPLSKTWMDVKKEIENVTYTDDDGKDVTITDDHIMQLVRMTTIQAAKQAKEWFGDASGEMMGFRRRLLDQYTARDQAVEEWRTKGSELSAQQQREAEESTRTVIGRFDDEIKGLREAMPDLFTADTKNAEEKGYFDKGSAIVDVAFRGVGLQEGITPEQRRDSIVRAQANVAAKASVYGVIVHRMHQKDKVIDELRAKLASYEKTEPGAGDQGRGGQPTSAKPRTPEDEIDSMNFEP